MDFRTRRLEQRRQQRLGCFILATAVVTAIVLAGIIMAFLPPIPFVATIAFYIVAVLIAGAVDRGLRRALGFQASKASLQHLKPDSFQVRVFPPEGNMSSPPVADSPLDAPPRVDAPREESPRVASRPRDSGEVESQSVPSSLVVKTCSNCNTRVAPKADGTCPACRRRFPEGTP